MARYIDANLAKEALTGWETEPTDEEIEYTIDKIQTADVAPRAEVVREIFEDIRNAMFPILLGTSCFDDYCGVMAELEKKHMKGE